jgi:hypothetical protein
MNGMETPTAKFSSQTISGISLGSTIQGSRVDFSDDDFS